MWVGLSRFHHDHGGASEEVELILRLDVNTHMHVEMKEEWRRKVEEHIQFLSESLTVLIS